MSRDSTPIHVRVAEDTPVYIHVLRKTDSTKDSKNAAASPSTRDTKQKAPTVVPSTSPKLVWIPPPAKTSARHPAPGRSPSDKKAVSRLATPAQDDKSVHEMTPVVSESTDKTFRDVGTEPRTPASRTVGVNAIEKEAFQATKELDSDVFPDESPGLFVSPGSTIKETSLLEAQNQLLNSSMTLLRITTDLSDSGVWSGKEKERVSKLQKDLLHATDELSMLYRALRTSEGSQGSKDDTDMHSRLQSLHKDHRILVGKLKETLNSGTPRTGGLDEAKSDTSLPHTKSGEVCGIEIMTKELGTMLADKETKIVALEQELRDAKHQCQNLESLKTYNEDVQARLRRELHKRESEVERMKQQIKNVDIDAVESERLKQLLDATRQQAQMEKDALKKAVRVEVQRAEAKEMESQRIVSTLREKDRIISELTEARDRSKIDVMALSGKKAELDAEVTEWKRRVLELETLVDKVESSRRQTVDEASISTREKDLETTRLKAENEHMSKILKDAIAQSDEWKAKADRLSEHNSAAESEIKDLKRRLEDMDRQLANRLPHQNSDPHQGHRWNGIASDRSKMGLEPETSKGKSIRDDKDEQDRLQAEVMSLNALKLEHEIEIRYLKRRIQDLEEATNVQSPRQTGTASHHGEEVSRLTAQGENLKSTNQSLQREIELLQAKVKHFNDLLNDTRAQLRTSEEDLTAARGKISQQERDRQEVEASLMRTVEDLRQKLERSEATNRSLQNYIKFLKISYANIFSDSAVASVETSPSMTAF